MIKKFFSAIVVGALLFFTAACSQNSTPAAVDDSITVQSSNGSHIVDVTVPRNPQRVAVLDFAALDTMDSLGLGGRVVGMPKSTRISYLSKYNDDKNIANLGTLKEVDMEALMASKPDVIFIGPRLADQYAKFSEIAPVILTQIDNARGYERSNKENVMKIASIFEAESQATEKMSGIDTRIAKLKQATAGKTAVMGMVTSSNFNTLGNDSLTGSLIFTTLGYKNLANKTGSTHGDTASLELLVDLDPEFLFVVDRDTAIGRGGAQTAKQMMDNELVRKTGAYKRGNIAYLSSEIWYLVTGGIQATDIMLSDIETVVLR